MSFRFLPPSIRICALALFVVPLHSAEKETHWAFRPIARPEIPFVEVKSTSVGNPIDAFIKARLAKEGLTLSPQADSLTLLRRLHLDLTGLPPSLEDISAFKKAWQADHEKAYRDKVDQLLDSPHFGEQWGRHWLDLARYADSDGYLGDAIRPWAWVYRDWVINAVNRDLPYDRFSIEQLAGDLLPKPSLEQKIATGFHRNTLRNTEAGVDLELYRTKEIVDRVGTTGTVWLGLTLACAECHEHKHDPVSQEEFYQLYAFYNNADEKDISAPLPGELENVEIARRAWEDKAGQLERPIAKLEEEGLPSNQLAWEKEIKKAGLPSVKWQVLQPDKLKSGAGDKMEVQKDGSVVVTGKDPPTVTYFVETVVKENQTVSAFRLETFGGFGKGRELGKPVGRGKGGEFVLSSFAVQVESGDGKVSSLKVKTAQADYAEKDQALKEVLDTGSNEGWHVASSTHQPHTVHFQLMEPVPLTSGSRIKFTLRNKFGEGKTLRHFRLSMTPEMNPGKPSILSEPVAAILAVEPEQRSPEQMETITDFYRAIDPEWSRLRLTLEKHLAQPAEQTRTRARVFVERSKDRRETFVHVRGDYTRHGERALPGTLGVLHPLKPRDEKQTPDRLDLAHWLFDEANPLTPRVAANQVWQHLFGHGLVATPDDFGTAGSPPTHPELLDWLATEYRRLGWSRKSLIRLIVNSDTYRQSSDIRPEMAEYPSGNTLLWRQNRFRMGAEAVRDLHLEASGLLTKKVGGPGIRPPLPEFVSMVGRSVKWPVSEGDERYRRGMYIVLKRTVMYPMLSAFDAPDTSVSCSRRERTNTPMQALTLLNDPVFYECAKALGRDLYARHGDKAQEALREVYQRCLNREPLPAEMQTLLSVHSDLLRESGGEEVAMIAAVRVVMNLDEFVTRN